MGERIEVGGTAALGSEAALNVDGNDPGLGPLGEPVDDWDDLAEEGVGPSCPLCSAGALLRVQRGKSYVWQCDNDKVCLYEAGDYDGRPQRRFLCNACCRPLQLTGAYGGQRRWACGGYFDEQRPCETAHPDSNGQPAYHLGQRLGKRLNGSTGPTKKDRGRAANKQRTVSRDQ